MKVSKDGEERIRKRRKICMQNGTLNLEKNITETTERKTMQHKIDYWRVALGIETEVVLEPISREQVVFDDDVPEKDKYFIGITRGENPLVITHDRPLTEEDIVHELLHIAYPDKDEDWVNAETDKLLRVMTKEKILDLRPEFKFRGTIMIDWFEVTEGAGFFCIRNGLRHADGETKSPYHYEECIAGDGAKEISLEKFNKWWNEVNKNIDITV